MNDISIWKDKILLKWDGLIPPGAPDGAIHDPDDVVHFWDHLKGYARFSKRTQKFMLNFGKQNMLRLHNQFGEIPIRSGRPRVAELKRQNNYLADMVQKARLVKDSPFEKLPQYSYKMDPLGEFQHREVVFLVNVDRAPIFADCGTGKTYCVLNSTEIQIQKGLLMPGKTLICGKLTTLETGWMEDAAKFTGLKVQTVWLPTSTYKRKEKLVKLLNEPADVYLINHDGLRVLKDELVQMGFWKVVVDESTILKGFHGMNPRIKGGQFGRALIEVSWNARWRVIMSGTPAPNGPEDLWGQLYFLDPNGILLEPSFSDFRQEYYRIVDLRGASSKVTKDGRTRDLGHRDPKKFVPQSDAIERIAVIVNPLAYRVKIRDHLKDLPELTVMPPRKIEMTKDQTKHYKDMNERLKVVIDDTRITVPIRLAQRMKLRQITGGFIIDNQEKAHPMKINPKLDELDSLLNEEIDREHKVLIYGQFRWEIEMIRERYKHHGLVTVYGGNKSDQNLKNIKIFREDPKCRLIVLHPKSAAHGITLTMAHYLIFYSIDNSAENNYQAVKRIERAGQRHPMFVYYLLCKKSVDEDIFKSLGIKDKNQSALIDPEFSQSVADSKILELWREDGKEQMV